MKAINLIPSDQRRGAGGAAGRSGGAAYGILGLLALALLIFASWTITNKQITEKTAEAASLESQAQIRTAQSSALGPYTKFAELRGNRVRTVKQLVDSRFDWAHAFGEVSRILPDTVWLTGLTGTIAPGVGTDVGGASDPLRTARPAPALEMAGCATTQTEVSKFIGRLRLINGVDDVAISKSAKQTTDEPDKGSEAVDSPQSGTDGEVAREDPCTGTRPVFNLVIFFKGLINPPGKTGKPELKEQAPAPAAGQGGQTATNSGNQGGGGAATTQASTTPATTTSTPAPGGTR